MTAQTSSGEQWGVHGAGLAVAALRQAISAGRLSHAYLLTGPAGVGKATLARRLAAALLCERGEPAAGPCLECRSCRRVEAGEAPDVERIAIGGVCDESGAGHRDHQADGSTRVRICQMRRLERVASLTPFQASRRIFVIDTADDLQTEAAHALLKTLEEPPGSVLLVLLATDPDELLRTIRSRCQELALRPLPHAELVAALCADLGVDAETADELAREARGRYGLAQRLHTDPSLRMLRETASAEAERLAGEGRNARFDYASALAGRWWRERQSVINTVDVWRDYWSERLRAAASGSSGGCTPADALHALRATQRARDHLLENVHPQLALEVMMLDIPALAASEREEIRAEARP